MKTCVAWFTVAGCILGVLGATFVYTVERPVFESTAIFRPLRPADDKSGASHREWLNTEAAIGGSDSNFQRVARNLNLEREWAMSTGECAAKLKEIVRVSLAEDTSLISVTVRGTKVLECAAIANGVVSSREEILRETAQEAFVRQRQEFEMREQVLKHSSTEKRAALVSAIKKETPAAEDSDASLLAADLRNETAELRDAWKADVAQLTYTKETLAELKLPRNVLVVVEIVQNAAATVTPVGPLWFPRAWQWSAMGAGLGLVAGVFVAALRRRMPPQPKFSSPASSMPLGAVEY